jgi:hypothetical protein
LHAYSDTIDNNEVWAISPMNKFQVKSSKLLTEKVKRETGKVK